MRWRGEEGWTASTALSRASGGRTIFASCLCLNASLSSLPVDARSPPCLHSQSPFARRLDACLTWVPCLFARLACTLGCLASRLTISLSVAAVAALSRSVAAVAAVAALSPLCRRSQLSHSQLSTCHTLSCHTLSFPHPLSPLTAPLYPAPSASHTPQNSSHLAQTSALASHPLLLRDRLYREADRVSPYRVADRVAVSRS